MSTFLHLDTLPARAELKEKLHAFVAVFNDTAMSTRNAEEVQLLESITLNCLALCLTTLARNAREDRADQHLLMLDMLGDIRRSLSEMTQKMLENPDVYTSEETRG